MQWEKVKNPTWNRNCIVESAQEKTLAVVDERESSKIHTVIRALVPEV